LLGRADEGVCPYVRRDSADFDCSWLIWNEHYTPKVV
jgi:hypothetical protein